MSTAFLVVANLVEAIGLGLEVGFSYRDGKLAKRTREQMEEDWKNYVLSLSFLQPVDLHFKVYQDDCAKTYFGTVLEDFECFDNPNIVISKDGGFPKYKTARLYHDGKGGLVTEKTATTMRLDSENTFCTDGAVVSYYNGEFRYNPDIEEYFYDKNNNYIVGGCCPEGQRFDGSTCVDKSIPKVERTDAQRFNMYCKREFGLEYELDYFDNKSYYCKKKDTLYDFLQTIDEENNPVEDVVIVGNVTAGSIVNTINSSEYEGTTIKETPVLSEKDRKELEYFRNIVKRS